MCSKVTLITGQGQQDRACSSEICLVRVFLVGFFCLSNLVHLHMFTSLCHPHCPSPLVTLLNLELGTLSWRLAASSSHQGWRIWLQAVLSLAPELCTCLRCSAPPIWTHTPPLPWLLAGCLLWIKQELASVRKGLHRGKRRKKSKEWL